MMIDENRIEKNLKEVVIPRLSGTENERKVFNIVKEKIEDLNLNPKVQNFSFTTFYPRTYQKLVMILAFWFLLILFLNLELIFTIINLILISIIFIPFFILTRKPETIKIGKKFDSQNLYVQILADSEEHGGNDKNFSENNKKGNLLFLSHLDSKGQRISINLRGIMFKLWFFSFVCCMIIIILKNLILSQYSLLFYILGVIPLILNLIATIFIFLNSTNNISPGAVDNASGIVCVLELLNYFTNSNIKLKNYNLWFLFTGAEETGTMGIRNLFHEKIKNLNKNTTYFFNFDSIGKKLDVYASEKGVLYFKDNNILDITFYIRKKLIRTTRSDGYYLSDKNFQGFGFGDTSSYRYIHTKEDTIDKIDVNMLKKFLIYMTKVINKIDKEYRNLI